METTFFPKMYDGFCNLINRGRPYILGGKVEQNWGAVTLTASHMRPLSQCAEISTIEMKKGDNGHLDDA